MKENKYKKYIDLIEYHLGNGIDFARYKLLPLIIEQKILSAIVGAIILITATTLIITISENKGKSQIQLTANPHKTQNTLTIASSQASKEAAMDPSSQNNNTNQQSTLFQSLKPSGNPASQNIKISREGQSITPTKAQPKPSSSSQLIRTLAQGSTGSTGIQGNQGSQVTQPSTPTITPTEAISNNPPQIAFIDTNGQKQVYAPSDAPPIQVTWLNYINNQEHYSIEYPSNWQLITKNNAGHEEIFVYMPGVDSNDQSAQYISFGWSANFTAPPANYTGPFVLDIVQGTIYTNGSIGSSYIAAVFRYVNGYLVLNNNVSDDVFAYVFNHMLLSLYFNPS